MEKLYRVFISNGAWDEFVGFWDNKIELEFKLIRYRKDLTQVDHNSIALPSKLPSAQKGIEHQYNQNLFEWNVSTTYALNYRIYMWEEDSNGDGVTVTLSTGFKMGKKDGAEISATAAVSFNISNNDDPLGDFEVQHNHSFPAYYYLNSNTFGSYVSFVNGEYLVSMPE